MDEREANIDLVFRNGLKDYEVLPPPEFWDSIQPVIKRNPRSFILLRAAALVTVVLSLSFFAYRLSMELSSGAEQIVASNEETMSPEILASITEPVQITPKEKVRIKADQKLVVETVVQDSNIPSVTSESLAPEVKYLSETKNISINTSKPLSGLTLASLSSPRKYSFPVKEVETQYIPEESPLQTTERWSIAALASPTYYSRFNSGKDEFSKQMMASEQPIVSYSGGVALAYRINNRLSLQTGLYYSSLGQDLDGISSFGGFQKYDNTKGDRNFEVLTTSGTVYTNNADVFLLSNGSGNKVITSYTNDVFDPEKASLHYINSTMRQTFSYLELPVVLRYKVVDKTIDLNLIGGLSYNILVNNSVYTLSEGSKYLIGKTEGLNPVSLSSSLGMGMEYNFSDNLSLNLEPMFRYYLNPFTESAGSNFHPYSFGIFSGMSFKF